MCIALTSLSALTMTKVDLFISYKHIRQKMEQESHPPSTLRLCRPLEGEMFKTPDVGNYEKGKNRCYKNIHLPSAYKATKSPENSADKTRGAQEASCNKQ